jgi:HSP20 family protein
MEVKMFRRFSNAFDTLLSVQQALDAARRSDYFEYHTSNRGAYPFINLFQDGYDTILTAEIPGVKKEDINIEVKNNLIRISGKRTAQYPEKSSVHRMERRDVDFDRTLKLPARVDGNKISAEYNNGVLKVVLPRAEEDKPKMIKVA